MCKQFHSGNILNKKISNPGVVRDLKTDCAKRTEEVRSGFCNIVQGAQPEKTEMTSKAKNCFLVSFFMFRLAEGEKRQEEPLIG